MLSDDDFRQLLQFLDRPWAGYRRVRKGVKKRVRRHMTALGCPTIGAYLQIIGRHEEERRRCEQALIVTISRFFRDRHLWLALSRRILPGLINTFDPPIRIWSAGCANGEEAYSLAMIWRMLPAPPALKILATDTSPESLERAKQGIYKKSSLKEVPGDLQTRFFHPYRRHQLVIQPRQLTPIQWQQHNLFDAPPAGPFHMILLRNSLLTYHQGPALENALNRIVSTLVPGGFLVVGSHERLPDIDVRFIRDTFCAWIYQRKIRSKPPPS